MLRTTAFHPGEIGNLKTFHNASGTGERGKARKKRDGIVGAKKYDLPKVARAGASFPIATRGCEKNVLCWR